MYDGTQHLLQHQYLSAAQEKADLHLQGQTPLLTGLLPCKRLGFNDVIYSIIFLQ